jgi:hypothetical protein
MRETVAFEDAAGVGVNDKDGMFAGVEKDGVGGFAAYTPKAQKLFAKALGWSSEQAVEGAAVLGEEKSYEGLESLGLLVEVAGWAEARGEPRRRSAADCRRR